jgi:hypothetical protein
MKTSSAIVARIGAARPIPRTVPWSSILALFAPMFCLAATPQQYFASPQAGVSALIMAVKNSDEPELRHIFGVEGSKLLSSGDTVEDAQSRNAFSTAYDEANKIVLVGQAQATLVIGKDEWPMPIPLINERAGWRFDTLAGEDEILKRRIGRNEIEAMQVCMVIVDAEHEYAARQLDSDGVPVYASRFTSSTGKRDGLYWPTQGNEAESPLGPLLAAAADDGYAQPGVLRRAPYHGYYFRILTGHGKNMSDGVRDYLVKGKMIGGFALVAYPAGYGTSGVTSFLVDQEGVIYEKDLGQDSQTVAAAITAFNPSDGWKKAEQTN